MSPGWSQEFREPVVADLRDDVQASFEDRQSGLRIEVHEPRQLGPRWREYLDGAEARYREHGILHALRREQLEQVGSASLVFVAIDESGEVVGGIRCHGPLPTVASAAALGELAGMPRLHAVRQILGDRIGAGLIEVKGAWAKGRGTHRGLSDALARCHVHAMSWFDVEHAICTCSLQTAPRWETTGGRAMPGFEPVPYPDDRYQTVLLWWRRADLARLANPEQWGLILEETDQLGLAVAATQGRAS